MTYQNTHELLSDIVVHTKYAKYLEGEHRRETWDEIVTRNKEMHQRKYPVIKEEIENVYKLVYARKVLPSMRALQFSGVAIEINPARQYNCSYIAVDDYHAFSEAMFLLLSGCGVGFSVQERFVKKLPKIKKPSTKRHIRYKVGDSIEGWADCIKAIMKNYFFGGQKIVFDYSDIRPKGARLVTGGGKAPGPAPLKECILKIENILETKANGEKLTSLEVHDIMCHIANAVLAGGVRRSAVISLFDIDSDEMLAAKVEQWWELNPQRGRANNSAVMHRNGTSREEFDNVWKRTEMSNAGEPGILWTNDYSYGTNPCCVSGDTQILTNLGNVRIDSIDMAIHTHIIVDGKSYQIKNWMNTGKKLVYKVSFEDGMFVKTTDDHKIKLATGDFIRCDELEIGDSVMLNKTAPNTWNGKYTFGEGWLIGSLLGDGNKCDGNAYLDYWGENAQDMIDVAGAYIVESENLTTRTEKIGGVSMLKSGMDKGRISSRSLYRFSEQFFGADKHLKESSFKGVSSEFIRGFICGWFDADGSVQGNLDKGISVRLSSIHLHNLQIAQRLMSSIGVFSKVYHTRQKAGYRMLPDGKGGEKEYFCQATNELVVSREAINDYCELINFKDVSKSEKLKLFVESRKKSYKSSFVSSVADIEYVGEEDVYDIEVEDVHEFSANGIIVHNCEISIKSLGFCNLCEVNASDVSSQEELNERVRAAAFIGTLQAGYTDFHYLRPEWCENAENEALLGISMTGICSGAVLKLDLKEAARVVKEENIKISTIIGINPAKRLTCNKPSGTSSIVLGSSSGIHAWHAPYYIRRIRVGKNEAIYHYLMSVNPEIIVDDIYRPHDTAIVELPIKAPDGAILRTENVFSMLERIKKFSIEWIKEGHVEGPNSHNVSATIPINKTNRYRRTGEGFVLDQNGNYDEWEAVGEWMWFNRNHYNGLSVLPFDGGSYMQTPFEDITQQEYTERLSKVKFDLINLKNIFEAEDLTDLKGEAACGAGGCELK